MSNYEILKNHLRTINEAGECGAPLDFDEEAVKVLSICKDFKSEVIKELEDNFKNAK